MAPQTVSKDPDTDPHPALTLHAGLASKPEKRESPVHPGSRPFHETQPPRGPRSPQHPKADPQRKRRSGQPVENPGAGPHAWPTPISRTGQQ